MKQNITQIQFIPASIALILQLLLVLIFAPMQVSEAPSLGSYVGVVGEMICQFSLLHPILSKWLAVLIISVSTFSLLRATSRLLIYGFSCYIIVPLTIISLLGGFYYEWLLLGALIFGLMVEAISQLFRSVNPGNIPAILFNGALCLGAISLIYAPAVTLWLAIPVLSIMLGRTLREFVVMMCGVVLPVLLFVYVEWLLGSSFGDAFGWYVDLFSDIARWSFADISLISISIAAIFALITTIAIPLIKVSNLTKRAQRRFVITIIIGFMAALSAPFCPSLALLAALLTPTVAVLSSLTLVDSPKGLSMIIVVVLMLLFVALYIF